ncbi:MAG TPA: formate dehydrogenase accessory sulfurtransferase FdhD, partial [Spirochaetia bacterium]|nr:formate dehydrogenase accessory sulfurtransferase FdhD [Spirochaetia bacterium]
RGGAAGPGSLPYFVVREDVGRHNAVDKVLGRGLLDGADFSRSVLLTSGRIAADMAQKAAKAGLPVLVSRSIPTTEAYAFAREAGITLIGRIGTPSPIVYTRPELVRPEAKE